MRRRSSPDGARTPRPLEPAALEALALHYVGRYATTRAKLAAYLGRKLRERGWAEGAEAPAPEALAARLAGLGYVDDRGYADVKAASLARRGYGARRVAQALHAAGIGAADGAAAEARARDGGLAAALALARRRRIGPYARAAPTPETRAKAVATLLRGGHDLATARRVAGAPPGAELEGEED